MERKREIPDTQNKYRQTVEPLCMTVLRLWLCDGCAQEYCSVKQNININTFKASSFAGVDDDGEHGR